MRLFASLAVVVVFSALPGSGADVPSGSSLMQRFIQVSGGEVAYAKIKSVSMSGDIQMAGRNVGGSVNIVESGQKAYMSLEFAGIGKVEECYDGVNAWESSAISGPRLLEGDEKASIRQTSTIAVIADWRATYRARTVGSEDVGGKPAWKVEMTPKEGQPETFYFDRESGLLVRVKSVINSAMGNLASDLLMSDYQDVSGIRTPLTMTEQVMSQDIVMHFTSVVYNGPIPAGRFDPPADVAALLQKKR
jgi:hypothetical protein